MHELINQKVHFLLSTRSFLSACCVKATPIKCGYLSACFTWYGCYFLLFTCNGVVFEEKEIVKKNMNIAGYTLKTKFLFLWPNVNHLTDKQNSFSESEMRPIFYSVVAFFMKPAHQVHIFHCSSHPIGLKPKFIYLFCSTVVLYTLIYIHHILTI